MKKLKLFILGLLVSAVCFAQAETPHNHRTGVKAHNTLVWDSLSYNAVLGDTIYWSGNKMVARSYATRAFTSGHVGLVPASGTANGTKVLYDNGTWVVPNWSALAGTPTTLLGYSISDTKSNFDNAVSDGDIIWQDDDTGSVVVIYAQFGLMGVKPYLDDQATYALVADSCYGVVRYNDRTDVIDYTLPPAQAGLAITFKDVTGGVITVDTYDGTDQILLNDTWLTAGHAIDSPGDIGNQITLVAIDDSRWVMYGRSGAWIDGGTD